ncbi:MAG: Crp/Fnr family transcriptional regulator [Myxococcota bacterium]
MRNKASFIRKAPCFQGADAASIQELAEVTEVKRVARRAPLWVAGDRRRVLVLVRSGIIRETAQISDHVVTLGFFGRNELVGGEVAFGFAPGGSAEAYEDSVVLQFPARTVRTLLERDPGIASSLARGETERRFEIQQRMGMVAHRTAPQRLASCFLALAKRFGVRDSRGTIVNLRLTHKEMASYIGATRETVSFAVTDMRREGLIETEGKRVVLLDRPALTALSAGG